MNELFEIIFSQPLVGIVLILIGFIFSVVRGQSKAYNSYRKKRQKQTVNNIFAVASYLFVALGAVCIIIANFKNPEWGGDIANIIIACFILGIPIIIMLAIKFITYKFYKKKYIEENRHEKMVEEVNLIMTEFGDKPPKEEISSAEPEPELSEKDEEFLTFLKNKYLKENK